MTMPPIFTLEKREEINNCMLQAGIKLIKEFSLRKLRVEQVTKESGIAKGTFYHFYESKELFIRDVLAYSKESILQYLNEMVEHKGGIDRDAFYKIFSTYQKEDSMIYFMTADDEAWLLEKMPQYYAPDAVNEAEITKLLFSKMLGLRENVNPQVVANMMKIMALSIENRKLLHEKALTETIQLMVQSLCDYMFL
ncbi:TetR/AcrR family transcriptional regulator [Clostridium estertheticum]|uniref:TetR/AcrR family transcriptional regulator n=2 Tax=Clostridium estertheticum TaxID=238834 RepID=UPI00147942EE|nr:TetR/AcrR family transcriptional regulator [Clostridium estertheticum]MBZ9618381.1 TetR/AcrR family transcriptional regulator [Clostridium estertheticum subsp. laramiense]MCB2343071.1 TetR/AcrR family transcriptional regulator [Clostridium estertheticum]